MLFTDQLEQLFKDTWHRRTGEWVYDTNRGWCYQFAVLLGILYPQAVYHWDHGGHCWVEIDGKFYDSTVPYGVDDHSGISFSPTPQHRSTNANDVADFWHTRGRSGPIQWDIVREVADIYRGIRIAA